MGSAGPKDRTHPRANIRWPVTLHLDWGPVPCETGDLSAGGAYIYRDQPVEVGEMITMSISPPDRPPFQATVEVMWTGKVIKLGMGVCFREISEEDREYISNAVLNHLE